MNYVERKLLHLFPSWNSLAMQMYTFHFDYLQKALVTLKHLKLYWHFNKVDCKKSLMRLANTAFMHLAACYSSSSPSYSENVSVCVCHHEISNKVAKVFFLSEPLRFHSIQSLPRKNWIISLRVQYHPINDDCPWPRNPEQLNQITNLSIWSKGFQRKWKQCNKSITCSDF